MTLSEKFDSFENMLDRLSHKFFKWIILQLREFYLWYLGGALSLVLLHYFQTTLPIWVRDLTLALEEKRWEELKAYHFLFLAFGIIIFRTMSRLLFFYPARVQQRLLRLELLKYFESSAPIRWFSKEPGQIFQVLFDDINSIRALMGFGVLQISNVVIGLMILIPRINENADGLKIAFLPMLISMIIYGVVINYFRRYYAPMLDQKGKVQQFVIESFQAKQTIKNFHQENVFYKYFSKLCGKELDLFWKISLSDVFSTPIVFIGLWSSLIWAAYLIHLDGGGTSRMLMFAGFLYLLFEPVIFLSWIGVVLAQGYESWKRIKSLYLVASTPHHVETELSDSKKLNIDNDKIECELNFWDKNLKLSFPKNKWTVLIGKTGCGKSHVLYHLATMLRLQKINISFVSQNPYLFNDTIEENIFLGRDRSAQDLEQAFEYLKLLGLDSLTYEKNELFKLEVGENGKRLSGGQAKRLVLVRSLMSGVNYFIWDDPFSSLDIVLEKKIINSLRRDQFLKNKTFIVTSHRLTCAKLTDWYLYLDKESGLKYFGPQSNMLEINELKEYFEEQLVQVSS